MEDTTSFNNEEFRKQWELGLANLGNSPIQFVKSYDDIHWILQALKAREPFFIDGMEGFTSEKSIFEGEQRELLKNKLIELLK